MQVSIAAIKENFNETAITISAQEYLKNSMNHGFIQTSEMYLEDDIPHIQMKKSNYFFGCSTGTSFLVIKSSTLRSKVLPFFKDCVLPYPLYVILVLLMRFIKK